MRYLVLTALIVCLPAGVEAQRSELTPPLIRAFDHLLADSLTAATEVWSEAWTGPADSGKAEVLLQGLRGVRGVAGPFRGYDVVKTELITPHLHRTYVLMLFERLPAYAVFVSYNPTSEANGWIVNSVNWNTDASKAWPASLY